MKMFCVALLLCFLGTCFSQSVSTDCGTVAGYTDSGLNVFLGIPYATPPVGSLRWRNSISLKAGNQCWSGVLNATSIGSECYQGGSFDSEDCLFINVYAPTVRPSSALLPTLFFIHGGGFNTGTGAELDGVPFLVASNLSFVLVTINYRLNGFGFLALPELSANSTTGTSGNYGVSDMLTALKWVKTNIANFGGNPQSVTIFGQSSGGTGVLMLLISPLATGYFHKAILMSASTRVDVNLTTAERQNRIFVQNSQCDTAARPLDCLYSLTASQVFDSLPFGTFPYWGHDTDFSLPNKTVGDGAYLGIVDGHIVPFDAVTALTTKKYSDVPTIFGSMAQEIDIAPGSVILDYTECQYDAFITEQLQPFNDPALTQGALTYYSYANYFGLPQLAYDSLGADIHTTCGQSYLAQLAATSFTSPVYRYVGSQWPSVPLCYGPPYCPRYAFHAWDLFALTNAPYFVPTESDTAFGANLRKYFLQLANHGVLTSEWPKVNSQGNSHVVNLNFNNSNHVDVDWHSDQCKFLWRHNFYQYSWNS